MFRRGGVFYVHDNQSGKQESLHTRSRSDAEALFHARNQCAHTPLLNRDLGRVYLAASDPEILTRTWSTVMAEICTHGRVNTKEGYARAMRDSAFDGIRDKLIVETTAADLLACLRAGTNSTHHHLHRLHNLALGLGWLHWPILAPKLWPKCEQRKKRGVSEQEHQKIVAAEGNVERRHYYELLKAIGASQSDAVKLSARNIDWANRVLWYHRNKLDPDAEPARITIGPRLETLLKQLPQEGALFPKLGKTSASDRAAEFSRRCKTVGIEGVSLHSYRYAWAERAYEHGYPERFAQAALGHSSKAVHQAYAKRAKVICPSLEDYEGKIIPLPIQEARREPKPVGRQTLAVKS
jgi:integrase